MTKGTTRNVCRISEVIADIAMGPFGSNIKTECYTVFGVPVLNGSNLTGFELNETSFNYVSREKADSLSRSIAHRGDIVITHRGTLGQIVLIPENSKYPEYVISQSQFRITCDRTMVIPEYLVFYFHTRQGQHDLLSNSSQVGVPALARPTTTFQTLEIPLPSIDEQTVIVRIISHLNQKIAVNNQLNGCLAA